MSEDYPLVRIVDARTPTAQVLYDCNATDIAGLEVYVEHEGFGIGVPQMLGDPDTLAVDWDLRTLKIPHVIRGPKAAALACQSKLARVLLQRRRFWVFMQLDADTAPVWWHGYRSQPGEVPFDSVYVDEDDQVVPPGTPGADPLPDTWQIALQIAADPWGSLERRDIAALTIGNEPTTATPPAYRVPLPTIDGETLARPRLQLTVTQAALPTFWAVIAVHGLPDPVTVRDFGPGDTWIDYNVSTDTPASTTATNAAYLAGSYRQRLVDTVLRPRFVDNRALPVGRYRVFLRVAAPAITLATPDAQPTTMQVGLLMGGFGSRQPTLTTVKFPGTAGTYYPQWVDLGTEAVGMPDLPADVETASLMTTLSLHAQISAGGSQQVRFDSLLLVRIAGSTREDIDADTLTTQFATTPNLPTVIDSDAETFWAVDTDGRAVSALDSKTSGGFPTLDPTRSNTLVVIPLNDYASDATAHVNARTATRTIGLSYHPQVLWLGDGQPDEVTT